MTVKCIFPVTSTLMDRGIIQNRSLGCLRNFCLPHLVLLSNQTLHCVVFGKLWVYPLFQSIVTLVNRCSSNWGRVHLPSYIRKTSSMVVSSIRMHEKAINILVMILSYSLVFCCTNDTMEMIWRGHSRQKIMGISSF